MLASDVVVFGAVAGIIAIGFGGELFFKRTGIPSFLFLILIGIVLGPVLGVFPGQALIPVLGIIAELTLIMVIFYSGMDMKLGEILSGSGRVLVQVSLYVIPSTIAIGFATHFLFGWDLIQSLIFGSMIGGETTAAVVIPLSRALKLDEKVVTFITLESVINSIFSIVIFFAFLGVYQTGSTSFIGALSTIASQFSVGIVLGAVLSFVWILILNYYRYHKYTYVFTLGLLFGMYAFSQMLGGSGALSALVFGVTLGSYKILNNLMKGRHVEIDHLLKQLKVFQGEISFLLETFFFVFLGLIFQVEASKIYFNVMIGLLLVAILIAFRFLAVRASTFKSELQKDKNTILLMCAQGLTPATLAIIAVNSGIPLGDTFLNLVTYVIIFTNMVTTFASFWVARSSKIERGGLTEFLSGV